MKRLATMLACSQLICFILLSYGSGFSAGLWPSAHGLNWWRGRWRERVHTSTSYRINSWLYRLFVWFAHYVMTWLNGCSSSLSTHVRESSEHLCLHCCRCFCKHAKMSQFSTQAGCNTTWHKRHDLNRMCIPWSMAGKWRWSGCSDQCLWTGSRMATDVADGCDQEEFVGACQVSRALQLTSSDRNSEKRTTIGKNTKKTSCLSKQLWRHGWQRAGTETDFIWTILRILNSWRRLLMLMNLNDWPYCSGYPGRCHLDTGMAHYGSVCVSKSRLRQLRITAGFVKVIVCCWKTERHDIDIDIFDMFSEALALIVVWILKFEFLGVGDPLLLPGSQGTGSSQPTRLRHNTCHGSCAFAPAYHWITETPSPDLLSPIWSQWNWCTWATWQICCMTSCTSAILHSHSITMTETMASYLEPDSTWHIIWYSGQS